MSFCCVRGWQLSKESGFQTELKRCKKQKKCIHLEGIEKGSHQLSSLKIWLMDKILHHQRWWLSHYLLGVSTIPGGWCRISSINSSSKTRTDGFQSPSNISTLHTFPLTIMAPEKKCFLFKMVVISSRSMGQVSRMFLILLSLSKHGCLS